MTAREHAIPLLQLLTVSVAANNTANAFATVVTNPALEYVARKVNRQLPFVVAAGWTSEQILVVRFVAVT